MKKIKYIWIIILIIISLMLLLFILTTYDVREIEFISEPKIVSLEEVKKSISHTEKLYICEKWDSLRHKCGKNHLVKIVDDQSIVEKFINITLSLEETNEVPNWPGEDYSIYFLDKKGRIITMASF